MKKILIVSDYITNIGGIENFIQNSSDLLVSKNYEIKYLGLQTQLTKKKLFRQIMLPITGLNIYIAMRLIYIYIFWKPDIILFHSITRFLGRLPIWISGFLKSKKLLMYHDLGFISSYPSKIYDLDELPTERNRECFRVKSKSKPGKSIIKNFFIKSIVWLKYISISLYRYFVIRNIDKHLVPSSFMVDIVKNRGIKSQNIYIIGHFGERLK